MTDEGRRLLELLAASEDGSTEALLLAHESIEFAGLATAQAERTFATGRAIESTQVQITDAGRRALAERQGYPACRGCQCLRRRCRCRGADN